MLRELGSRKENDCKIVPPFKLLSLSATGCDIGVGDAVDVFRLSPEDRKEEIVENRLSARKRLTIRMLDDEPQLVPKLVGQAWTLGAEQKVARVLVYCDSREDAVKVKNEIDKQLKKAKCNGFSELLVGGRRVYEREQLSDWLKEHGFLGGGGDPPEQPTFLIATSAGEVGVDLDADHMVCDLVEWKRMVQRLGRVNRRGKGDARIEVIAAPRKNKPKNEESEEWKKELHRLACLRKPLDKLRPDDIQPWLRGWEEDQKPQTTVIWRKHLPVRRDGIEATRKDIEGFFEAAPPHASEKLETETFTVVD